MRKFWIRLGYSLGLLSLFSVGWGVMPNQWQNGYSHIYQISCTSSSWIYFSRMQRFFHDQSGGAAPAGASTDMRMRFRLEAQLVLSPIELKPNGQIILSAQLRKVSLQLSQNSSWANPQDLRRSEQLAENQTIFVETRPNGKIVRWWHSKTDDTDVSFVLDMFKSLLADIQVVAGSANETAWTVNEHSTYADYQVRYERSQKGSGRWTKRYLRVTDYPKSPMGESMKLSGLVKIAYDNKKQLVVSIEGTRQVSGIVEQLPVMEGDVQWQVEYRQTMPISAKNVQTLRRQYRSLVAQPVPFWKPATVVDTEQAMRVSYQQRLGTRTYDDLLRSLSQLSDSTSGELVWQQILDWEALIALNPNVCSKVSVYLEKLPPPSSRAQVLLTALASAGHKQAQNALARYIDHGLERYPADQMTSVIIPLMNIKRPTREMVQALQRWSQHANPEIAYNARLILGVAGRHLLSENPEISESIATWALNGLRQSHSHEETCVWILTLGNLGHSKGLPTLLEYLKSEDSELRQASATALRFIPGERAESALLMTLQQDPEASVRLAVVDALGFRPMNDTVLNILDGTLRSEVEVVVREKIVELLGTLANSNPKIRSILTRVAREDSNGEIRLKARAILGSLKNSVSK